MNELILIAEDEKNLNDMISDYLRSSGFDTFSVYSGPAALEQVRSLRPSLLVLDLMLPGLDGMEVTRLLRQNDRVPIVMLTARAGEADKLLGLEIGADDFVTKPFSVQELTARIRAILRRSEGQVLKRDHKIALGPFELDHARRSLSKNGRPVELTPSQFEFLHIMMMEPGRVFGRDSLIELASGYEYEGYERTVDTHVKNIRRAIEDDPGSPRYLLTVWGVGYKFEASA